MSYSCCWPVQQNQLSKFGACCLLASSVWKHMFTKMLDWSCKVTQTQTIKNEERKGFIICPNFLNSSSEVSQHELSPDLCNCVYLPQSYLFTALPPCLTSSKKILPFLLFLLHLPLHSQAFTSSHTSSCQM